MGKGSDTAAGAMGGAAAGAPLGPYGAAAGAVLGGAMGYFGSGSGPKYTPDQDNFMLPGYEGMNSQYNGLIGQGPRNAPQVGQSSFRGDQQTLISQLRSQANGNGAGQRIAREQAEIQTDRGLGQQLAMARSSRPGGGAMAARNAAMASGQLQGAGAQAATMGGLQAQQSALGQLGGAIQGARGLDLQRGMNNAQLQYQTMGLDDRRQLELLSQRLQMGQAQQRGGQQYESALGGNHAINMAQPTNQERMLGAAQGISQGYMQYKAGSGAGTPQQAPDVGTGPFKPTYGGQDPMGSNW